MKRQFVGLIASLMLASPITADARAKHDLQGTAAEAVQQQAKPNVLVWMLDDVGFAQLSCFGGLIATPNIDRVAQSGVRYSNFHTTPVCSPSRAAFLTGRNSHTVNMGGHNMFAREVRGYNGRIPTAAGTIAENMRQSGYTTFALGKWDHLPIRHTTSSGPFTYWPQGQGFDRFYGFVASETDNFHPSMWRNAMPVNPEGKDYHLNDDLADEAIEMIRSRDAEARPGPFFMYWATGTAHAPHHAPKAWIERYKGKFDAGWDEARADILKKQIAEGIVPKDVQLAPRPDGMPAWEGLSAGEKRIFARQMEVYAAALSHADEQFGRILNELERRGELDDTIVMIVSDNGASAEGGPTGTFNELLFAVGQLPTADENLRRHDEWGGPGTYPHYAFGWAVAGNTPFRLYKQTTYQGGIRVPLIISSPHLARQSGNWSDDFVHVSDLVPTIMDLAGVDPARTVNGESRIPFDGISVAYTLKSETKSQSRRSQYFEMFGHRGFWSDGWKIVSPSRLNTWDISTSAIKDQPWQLYNLDADPGEAVDRARRSPEKVNELASGFEEQAERYHVNPIGDMRTGMMETARKNREDFTKRGGKWSYTGPISRILKMSAPPIERGNFTVTAELMLDKGIETGPIFVMGGQHGGAGFYLKDGRPNFIVRSLEGEVAKLAAPEAIGAGEHELALRVSNITGTKTRRVTISIDGRQLVSRDIVLAIPATVPESFDIARDDATPVSDDYEANAMLEAELNGLKFEFDMQE